MWFGLSVFFRVVIYQFFLLDHFGYQLFNVSSFLIRVRRRPTTTENQTSIDAKVLWAWRLWSCSLVLRQNCQIQRDAMFWSTRKGERWKIHVVFGKAVGPLVSRIMTQVCWRCMNRSSKDADFGQAGPRSPRPAGGLSCHIAEVDEGFDLQYWYGHAPRAKCTVLTTLLWQERYCLLWTRGFKQPCYPPTNQAFQYVFSGMHGHGCFRWGSKVCLSRSPFWAMKQWDERTSHNGNSGYIIAISSRQIPSKWAYFKLGESLSHLDTSECPNLSHSVSDVAELCAQGVFLLLHEVFVSARLLSNGSPIEVRLYGIGGAEQGAKWISGSQLKFFEVLWCFVEIVSTSKNVTQFCFLKVLISILIV